MKIERLELPAYGCFTNMTLDFAGVGRNMVVVYGSNEAGKSTALSAIRHWLFGFEKSPKKEVDFVHKSNALRIAGTLSIADRQLTAIRRKGNKDTLLASDNKTPLKEEVLAPFLKSITAKQFEESFGLNLERLAAGGDELAQGKGDLGEALFSAASGVLSLQRLRSTIRDRRDALFTPRASNPTINACLREYSEAESAWKKSLVSAKDTNEAEEAVKEAERQSAEVSSKLAELRKKHRQWGILGRAKVLVNKAKDLDRQRAPLAGVKLLRPDFAVEFSTVSEEYGRTSTIHQQLKDRLSALEAEINGIVVDQAILGESQNIIQLIALQPQIQKADVEISKLDQLIRVKKGEAKQALRNLRLPLDDLEALKDKLRLSEPERRRLRSLASEYSRLKQAKATAEKEKTTLSRSLADARAKLEDSKHAGESQTLQTVIDETIRARDPEGVVRNLRQEIEKLTGDLEKSQSKLKVTFDERTIATTMMPNLDEITSFREQFDRIEREIGDLIAAQRTTTNEIAAVESKIVAAQVTGIIPKREDLYAARQKRDAVWDVIQHAWLAQEYDANAILHLTGEQLPQGELARVYVDLVRQTDDLADRLEREVDRVRELANLTADLQTQRKQEKLLTDQSTDAERRRSLIRREWETLWSSRGVSTKSPREMADWRREWDQLVERNNLLSNKRTELARAQADLDTLCEKLRRASIASGAGNESALQTLGFQELIDIARRKLRAFDLIVSERKSLELKIAEEEASLRNAEANLVSLQMEFTEWETNWRTDTARLREAAIPDTSPEKIDEIIEAISDFFEQIKFCTGQEIKLKDLQTEVNQWTTQLEALAVRFEESRPLPHSSVLCSAWHSRLKTAESARESLADRRRQRETLLADVRDCEVDLKAAHVRLGRLVAEAQAASESELPEMVRRSAELAELEKRITNEIRKPFEELAAEIGGSTSELERQALESLDRDLITEIEDLEVEIEQLDQRREEFAKKSGEAVQRHRELANRRGGIDYRAQMETALARIRRHIPEYATLALAESVLERAIERYRERNKSDLFETASRLFRQLTCERFVGLEVERGDDDEQLLVGLRPEGVSPERVPISGMSDGTRDQLYLALRLAHLAKHVLDHGPFPIIVDDLLLTFDDTRAKAALRCLVELSHETQVIFFTHHEHLKEMVEAPEFRDQIGVITMGSAKVVS